MRRVVWIVLVLAALGLQSCIGSGGAALPSPRPTGQRGNVLTPIDRTRTTVNQLNDLQQREEQKTDSGSP